MALSRVKSWVAAEVLYASDLNSEFNNILNNALALISPLTGNLNFNSNQATNFVLERKVSTQAAGTEGRAYFQTTENLPHADDSVKIYRLAGIEHLMFKLAGEVWS